MKTDLHRARRILFIQNGSGLGGSGESLLLLLDHLLARAYEPVVLTPNRGPLVERLKQLGVPVEIAPLLPMGYSETRFVQERSARDPLVARRLFSQGFSVTRALVSYPHQQRLLARLAEKYRPELVHLNELTLLVSGLAARSLRLPIVWHVRSILSDNVWGRWGGRVIPRTADAVVAVSQAAAGRLESRRGNVQVIYNGIDLSRFDPSISGAAARAHWQIPPGAACIGYVGKLIRSKGVFDLVEAAPAILSQAPDTHFLIVGGYTGGSRQELPPDDLVDRTRKLVKAGLKPPPAMRLEERIAQLGLSDRIHLTGPRSDVPQLLAAMDVVALPTWSEGFGRTVIEAMAMQRAVVSTGVDAICELITHRQTGLLTPARNPEALAQACLELIQDPELRRRCALQGCASARSRFDSQTYSRKIAQLYDRLLPGQAASGPE